MPNRMKVDTGRRWLRISIRALMALVLIIACALGWIVNRAHVQRDAVAAVRKAGGTAKYEFELALGTGRRPGLAAWQSLIANAIGVDFVSNVTCVAMPVNGSEANCQDLLARLGDFERLEYVNLIGPLIGDDLIASLRDKTRLQIILLQHARITNVGLAHLKTLTGLRQLFVNDCEVTDEGLLHLTAIRNLESLRLIDTQITDGGLQHLRALPNLKNLALEQTRVTDAGVPELKRLVGLSALSVSRTEISRGGHRRAEEGALPNTVVAR